VGTGRRGLRVRKECTQKHTGRKRSWGAVEELVSSIYATVRLGKEVETGSVRTGFHANSQKAEGGENAGLWNTLKVEGLSFRHGRANKTVGTIKAGRKERVGKKKGTRG